MRKRPYNNLAPQPPADVAAGATLIRAAAVKLYDKQDGTGADWRMVTDALFRAAFDALDKLPDDACRSVARRVHEGAYGRVTEGPASRKGQTKLENADQQIEPLNSPGPKSGVLGI